MVDEEFSWLSVVQAIPASGIETQSSGKHNNQGIAPTVNCFHFSRCHFTSIRGRANSSRAGGKKASGLPLFLAVEFLISGTVIAISDDSYQQIFVVEAINNTKFADVFSEVMTVAHSY
jgi:hypothetical protein